MVFRAIRARRREGSQMALIRIKLADTTEYLGNRLEVVPGGQNMKLYVNANVSNQFAATDISTVEIFTTRQALEVARGDAAAPAGGAV
jgi:hypothetical protein